ncbi:Replication protein A subunit [Mycena indigotica]|uniref:Replication protein A subunit n=1 Tax=Mycena indigotica TaxID=2126181 RepID=A0A8H6SAV6_9AGAR|nr:Replication protein A subunit [Mycena indigotica]KAF7295538.1 Replication protein A subunit [Mycena indigotica]
MIDGTCKRDSVTQRASFFTVMVQLSANSCISLHTAESTDLDVFDGTHTLQVLSVKPVESHAATAVDRYRIIIADGIHFVQAMLATQLNHLVSEDKVKKYTIVNITKMTCNYVQEKRLLIILGLDVIQQSDVKIGEPTPLAPAPNKSASASTTPAAPAPAASSSSRPPPAQAAAPSKAPRPAPPPPTTSNHGSIYPIEGLSPYQNTWTIKARVTQKSDLKTYSNHRGDGKLFNITLMDDTGEIRATAFNEVAGELYDRIQEGKVYYLSRARVNFAKKQFSHLNNEYELGLDKNTLCTDLTNAPSIKYNFTPLNGLEGLNKDSTCDVLAIVQTAGELATITSKQQGREISKRELTLVDQSKFQVRMTLWGKQAEQFNSEGSVIAFKNVKVGDFGGRSLSFFSSSNMSINPPDLEAAQILRGWFDDKGKQEEFQAYQSTGGGGGGGPFEREKLKSIAEVKAAEVDETKPTSHSIKATLLFIKHDNMWYPSCQTSTCNKKVTDAGDGWICDVCKKKFPKPEYRYIMSMACADHSEQAWLQGFNEVGTVIFGGKTATELEAMKEEGADAFTAFVQEHTCETFNFVLRAKKDDYNGQTRVRYGISKILPIDYREEMKSMRDQLLGPWGQTAI